MPDGLTSLDLGPRLDVWIALGLSVVIAALFIRARANHLRLPKLTVNARSATVESTVGLPDCMVVIPARNEAGFIGRAVSSLPPDSVIVVDDHSEDSTTEEARQAGAGVIKAPKLSRAASGKANACVAGARALTSKWILFTDADTCYERGFVDSAVACAEANSVAYLSIYLDPEYATIWQRLVAPYLLALFFSGANPRNDTPTVFNGQCLLMRRDAYEFLGGHSAVINELNEDVRLAAIAQRHRLKFGIVRANGLGRARWRDLQGMVSRGAFRFMVSGPMIGIMILIAAAMMAAWPPVVGWLLWQAEYRAAAAFAVLPYLLLWRWYPKGTASLIALALPLAVYASTPLLWRGLFSALSGGASQWGGRRA